MQSCCAAKWPKVCLHHPPDACGRVLLRTGTWTQNTERQMLKVQDQRFKVFWLHRKKILLLKNMNASYGILVQPCWTFQSSPVVPGPFPSLRAPTWQHLRRRPPRTAADPTAWSVLCLNAGTQNICSSFTLQSCTDFIVNIGRNMSVLCQSTRKLYTPRQSTPHN